MTQEVVKSLFCSAKRKTMGRWLMAAGLLATLPHCTPAFEGEYSDPAKEEIVDDRWNETDARKTAEIMIKSSLERPWLKGFKPKGRQDARPVFIVDEIENRTDEHIDTKGLTEAIRTELINSGKIRFANNQRRDQILKEIKYQQGGAVDPAQAKVLGKQLGADFFLGGAMTSIVATQGGLKTVTYQITLTLTDLETAEISWTDRHLIKKRFKRSGSSW